MKQLIAILGNGFHVNKIEGEYIFSLPKDVRDRVLYAATLYLKRPDSMIAVSGKWSVQYTKNKITPYITEAELMQKVLLRENISKSKIILDILPETTIENAISLLAIIKKYNFKKLTILYADFVDIRVKGIFRMVIPKVLCELELIPLYSRYTDDTKVMLKIQKDQKKLWKEQKINLEKIVSRIQKEEITMENIRNYIFDHGGSRTVAKAALGEFLF